MASKYKSYHFHIQGFQKCKNHQKRGQSIWNRQGYEWSLRKFSIIKVAVILAMSIKLHFVQLCKIWAKSDNLHFSLFHGVPPLQIFGFLCTDILWANPKICKGGTPWKSEKWRLSDLAQILHSCTKCNFMLIAKITATFIIENFRRDLNNPVDFR